jgi:hypothetical protein
MGPDPSGGGAGPLGEQVVCMRHVFILTEIWTQHKTCVLVGILLS